MAIRNEAQSCDAFAKLKDEEFRMFSDLIEDDIYQRLDLRTCMEKRNSAGGTSPESVRKQIEYIRAIIDK